MGGRSRGGRGGGSRGNRPPRGGRGAGQRAELSKKMQTLAEAKGLPDTAWFDLGKSSEWICKAFESIGANLASDTSKDSAGKHAASKVVRRRGGAGGTAPTPPISLKTSADAEDVKQWAVYEAKLRVYADGEARAEPACQGTYALVWLLTTERLREKIRGQDKFQEAEDDSKLKWLVDAIHAISTGFEGHRDPILSANAAAKDMFALEQGSASLDGHYEGLIALSDNMCSNGSQMAYRNAYDAMIAKLANVKVEDLDDIHFTKARSNQAFGEVHDEIVARRLLASLGPKHGEMKLFYENQRITAKDANSVVPIPSKPGEVYQNASLWVQQGETDHHVSTGLSYATTTAMRV